MRQKNITIGLVQINNSFSRQNYFPYSVGLLQAYAQKFTSSLNGFDFLLPIYRREPIEQSVCKLVDADIVFFSVYVWNINISIEIAKSLKKKNPNTVVIFGGPQVPDRAEAFIREHSFIDLLVHGEGERIFLHVIEHDIERSRIRDWNISESCSYLTTKGEFKTFPKASRLKSLDDVPSPYLEGVFDQLIAANPQEKWIVMWETNRGCPFSCTFCDWGSATQSKVYRFAMERLCQEVDWFSKNKIEFIFCCDANFGMLARDLDIVQYVADSKRKTGYPHALSVQNTKNATERAYSVQKLLADEGLNKGVTISLQSIDPITLKNVKRDNIKTESYQELQRRFTNDRVETYTDIILALPGENYLTYIEGISQVVNNGQHNRIQFNNLSILPNAAMGDPDYQKEHGLVMVECPVVNIHGSLEVVDNEIMENQILVVGTNTLSSDDWVKMRAFSWYCSFLYFNKVLQIPILLLCKHFDIPFHEIIQNFSDGDFSHFPILQEIQTFFRKKARDIQKGGAEYVSSKEYLNIWWPADEFLLIKLCSEEKLETFYQEAFTSLALYLKRKFISIPNKLLSQMFDLNKILIKRPFQTEDIAETFSYNVWEAYQAAKLGESLPIEEKTSQYFIDRTSMRWVSWEQWCKEVIWWGNKKGAYLYTNKIVEAQLAGHF